jgi:hypothetical protein
VLRTDKPLDIDKLSEFMNELLEDHGKQLLRYKGVLNILGEPRRMVFQGVLKLYGFDWDTEWAEGESRESVIVFIADDLPEEKIREGFAKVAAQWPCSVRGCRYREQARLHGRFGSQSRERSNRQHDSGGRSVAGSAMPPPNDPDWLSKTRLPGSPRAQRRPDAPATRITFQLRIKLRNRQ